VNTVFLFGFERRRQRHCNEPKRYDPTRYIRSSEIEQKAKAIIRSMNRRFKTKFNYTKIHGHRRLFEVDQYRWFKGRTKDQIRRTFGTLKSLHEVVSASKVQARKGLEKKKASYKSKDKPHLLEDLINVLQEFVQKQHIFTKRYLIIIKREGACERNGVTRQNLPLSAYYNAVSDAEVSRRQQYQQCGYGNWGSGHPLFQVNLTLRSRQPPRYRGWGGAPPTDWQQRWGGRQIQTERITSVKFNWGTRKHSREYDGEWS
jgi:hypothetical protein